MTTPLIARAEWIYSYFAVLRGIGVSVERALERSALPTWIEDMPDAYISVRVAVDWIARCGRDVAPGELAYSAAVLQSFSTLSPAVRDALLAAPTGLARMRTALKVAMREDSSLSPQSWREGDCVRLVCDTIRFQDDSRDCLVEWVIQQALDSCMRSIVGQSFRPVELTFVSGEQPCLAACEAYGDTRIRTGQPHTSMLVRVEDLERPCSDLLRSTADPISVDWEMDFVGSLQSLILPYLSDGYPSLGKVAKIVDMSPRSLQRKLQSSGSSYSSMVSDVRIKQAIKLLSDPGLRIVDIALAVGYEDPQNFSRIFRQMTGMTPSLYRKSLARHC